MFPAKTFKPIPPMKGSFPLDHEQVCRDDMIRYMKCLQDNKYNNESCQEQIKNYLACRMDNELMTKEPWDALGFKKYAEIDEKSKSTS